MHVGIILSNNVHVHFGGNYETAYHFYVLGEYTESTDDLKESIVLYGPYNMAKKLHSLDILNTASFYRLSNLQGLSHTHLASVLVDQLSQDIKEKMKYVELLHFLKKEPSLVYLYNKITFLSMSFI